jgi:hypothetical protein
MLGLGTYVFNSELVWLIFLLNSHSKPILEKRPWNHLQKLIFEGIQESFANGLRVQHLSYC